MWLHKLKIAVVQKNIEQLTILLDAIPEFKEKSEMEETLYLLQEAKTFIESLKDEIATSMAQIKRNLDFLNSATADKTSKFDITL